MAVLTTTRDAQCAYAKLATGRSPVFCHATTATATVVQPQPQSPALAIPANDSQGCGRYLLAGFALVAQAGAVLCASRQTLSDTSPILSTYDAGNDRQPIHRKLP